MGIDTGQEPGTIDPESLRKLVSELGAAHSAYSGAKPEVDGLIAEIRQKLKEIGELATQSVAASSKIADSQAVIAEKSAHIEDAKKHSDDVRALLDKLLTESRAVQTKVAGLESETQEASEGAKGVVAELRALKASVDSEAAAIKKLSESSANDAERTKNLADRAKAIDERIGQYESDLADLSERSGQTLKEIEGLLPGATSTGLASAFDKRRQTFLEPAQRWQWIFVVALIALVILASTGLFQFLWKQGPLTLEEELQFLLIRLPVAGALIWLALHASHESTLARRLEEDYGYKATVAASFQGFHKQMHDMAEGVDHDSAIAILCKNTLAAIADPPGRIYDKKLRPVTPTSVVTEAVKDVGEIVSTQGRQK